MKLSTGIIGLASAALLLFVTATQAGAPPQTVHPATINLKMLTQETEGGKIKNENLNTKQLTNLLLGNPSDDKVAKNMKLVIIATCDGELWPLFVTVWDTDAEDVADGAGYMFFDSDFTLLELDKNENPRKASAYMWTQDEGTFAEFSEVDTAVSARYKKLSKKLSESGEICIGTIKGKVATGEVIDDNEDGLWFVINGGSIKASKPIALTFFNPEI